jgi:hypothetical protein
MVRQKTLPKPPNRGKIGYFSIKTD